MCECELIFLKLAMCVCAVFFRCAQCDRNFARFLSTKVTNFISNLNDDFSMDSFYICYISVRQKLEILGFLPMGFFILSSLQQGRHRRGARAQAR